MMARPPLAKPAPREYVTRTYRVTLRQDSSLHAALVAARMGELLGALPPDGIEDLSSVVRAAVDEWLLAHVPARILRAFQPGQAVSPSPGRARGRGRPASSPQATSTPKRQRGRKGVVAALVRREVEASAEPTKPEVEAVVLEGVGDAR